MSDVKLESFSEKQGRLFKQFITNKSILIVDPLVYTRASLMGTMVELGTATTQIQVASSYNQAMAFMEKKNPNILFAEFDLDAGRCGLDLMQEQRKQNKSGTQNSLFFLVTANTSQAAVARAAEEDVDGYILKPYTMDGLRNAIMRYAVAKAYPSDYTRTIEQGKKCLERKDFDNALEVFSKAMSLDSKPSLACFYHGQAEQIKETFSNAEQDFTKGLSYNKIHYKCLVGLFELFMGQNRNKEAYEVVRKISRYFPANPERLASVLRLAVVNNAYEDIERYYQLFCKLDQRNDLLIRYVCAALIVCGKYYLQNKVPARAIELFNKAQATGFRQPKLLREIIHSLGQYDMLAEAEKFLAAYPPEFQGSDDYQVVSYYVLEAKMPLGTALAKGKALIQKGIKDPLLYIPVITNAKHANHGEYADLLYAEALKLWPDRRTEIEHNYKNPKKRIR